MTRRASGEDADPVTTNATSTSVLDDADEEYDVVVIGSGIGGLSWVVVGQVHGYKVKIFESHYLRAGAVTCSIIERRMDRCISLKSDRRFGRVWIVRRVIRCEWCSTIGRGGASEDDDGISMWTAGGSLEVSNGRRRSTWWVL